MRPQGMTPQVTQNERNVDYMSGDRAAFLIAIEIVNAAIELHCVTSNERLVDDRHQSRPVISLTIATHYHCFAIDHASWLSRGYRR